MITQQHTKECLSVAYVHAVAGRAGVLIGSHNLDYGVDGSFQPLVTRSDGRRFPSGFPIDYQLKTTTDWEHDGDKVRYDLEAKTYNDLGSRPPGSIPCVLILLCLPPTEIDWVGITESELVMRNCCYWTYISGPPTTNTATKRIWIPRANVLTPESVNSLLAEERNRQIGSAP